jgi:hypothetical protein
MIIITFLISIVHWSVHSFIICKGLTSIVKKKKAKKKKRIVHDAEMMILDSLLLDNGTVKTPLYPQTGRIVYVNTSMYFYTCIYIYIYLWIFIHTILIQY